MNKKGLEVFAKQAAKSIKSEADLTDFRKMLTKVTVEAALNAEFYGHLSYSRHEQSNKDNYRNGYSSKTIRTEDGEVDLDTPRDRDSGFEPQLVKKNQIRFTSMDDKILYLYFKEMYDADVHQRRVTNAVIEQVVEW